jgi:radical SAM protein with 4Fe4S-binding SPASM domain
MKLNQKLKFYLKEKKKIIARYYYESAPNNLKKRIHNFISSESTKKNFTTSLFDSVYFELRTRCNGTCSFCAASVHSETRPDISMDFELYKKAILELSDLNYKGIIAYHVNSDPLLIKDIDEYIYFARKHLKSAWIQILSNGKALNSINGKKIIDAGVNEIFLNIYNDDLKAELPKNVKKFEDEVLHKLFNEDQIFSGQFKDFLLREKPKDKFIYYNISRRLLTEVLTNRGGTSPNKKSNRLIENHYGYCELPFSKLNITANGKASQCCCDLTFSNPMGNINHQSLKEVWNSQKFTELRKDLLSGNRKNNPICAKCDYFGLSKHPKNLVKKSLYQLLKLN